MTHICRKMVLILVVLWPGLAVPAASYAQTPPQSSPLTIVYPVVKPPYSFEDEAGQAQGLAIDLLRLWSEKTGIAVRFTSALWEDGLDMMRAGQADIHASLYFAEQRDTYLDFVTVVASSAGHIFYHKNILGLSGPEDLKPYRVGVVRGSYHEQYIRDNLPEVSLVSYPEFPEMLTAAQQGEIRVFVEGVGTALYRLKELGLVDEFRHNAEQPLYRNNFWLAVGQGNAQLARALREGMALVTPEERAKLERKWLGSSSLKAKDVLDIAIQIDFSPYTFINAEGQPAGLFVDIWRLWSEKTGRQINFHATHWNDSLNSLKTGTTEIHSGLFYSESRAEWIDYSTPFYEAGSCFYTAGSERASEIPADLAGKKVGAVKGSFRRSMGLSLC